MTSHPFGTDWRFGPASAGGDRPGFDDSGFAEVTLPHTVVPLSWRDWDPSAWERVWMYRKRFDAPPGVDRGRVFLDFAAALTRATVTLNGAEVTDHLRWLPAVPRRDQRPAASARERAGRAAGFDLQPERAAGPA